MVLDELGGDHPVRLHPRMTVLVAGGASRDALLEAARDAVLTAAGEEVVADVVLRALDLPGARPLEPGAQDPDAEEPPVEDPRLDAARRALADAERDEDAARDALDAARTAIPATTEDDASGATTALEAATIAFAEAEHAVRLAEDAVTAERARRLEEEHHDQRRVRLEELRSRRAGLERRREEMDRVLTAEPPAHAAEVEAALERCQREAAASGEPLPEAEALADRIADARRRLAALGGGNPPPWLVGPAREALEEARAAVARAEALGDALPAAGPDADRVERAHRRVLEAEQRHMEKPSFLARRRLDAALEAERAALSRLGVASYTDYLQLQAAQDPDVREGHVAAARAALADAEAVWEELHAVRPDPAVDAVRDELDGLRREAEALVGTPVDDDAAEDALRSLRTGGDALEAARDELRSALRAAGVPDEGDAVATARRFVLASHAATRARADAETALSAIARELAWVEREIAALEDALRDDTATETEPDEVVAARRRLEEAESAVLAAQQRAAAARRDAATTAAREAELAEAEARLAAATTARAGAAAALAELEAEAADAASPPDPPTVDLGAVGALEAEVYVLARLAAQRAGAEGRSLPLIVDGEIARLGDHARQRVLGLLARMAPVVQVVIVGNAPELTVWAAGLSADEAAVQRVA